MESENKNPRSKIICEYDFEFPQILGVKFCELRKWGFLRFYNGSDCFLSILWPRELFRAFKNALISISS